MVIIVTKYNQINKIDLLLNKCKNLILKWPALLAASGPPGSGKTYLGNLLRDKYKDRFIYLSRDDIYSEIVLINSIRKFTNIRHMNLLKTKSKIKKIKI